jgi:glycosyltransferase involved in cell wall biosynthesis
MRIMVYDVPAEHGGALTILKQYYEKAVKDKQNEWFFVISTPKLSETENVKVLRYPWVKKSWFHRLYFDRFVAHKIARRYQVDEVLSLQNVIVQGVKVKQTLYLHQPLPFVEKRYRIIENFTFWVYQNLISRMIFNSIVKADKVIVQTNWMKEACIKKANVESDKFEVIQPKFYIEIKKNYEQEDEGNCLFFYPASGISYKNHKIIVDAVSLLKQQGIENYRVIFTLKGDENSHIKNLCKEVIKKSLPIDFIGQISIEDVYKYYSKSILIFPSYIETFGLPLLEAKMHKAPILASDSAFSHEILDGYDKVEYFDSHKYDRLAELMVKVRS